MTTEISDVKWIELKEAVRFGLIAMACELRSRWTNPRRFDTVSPINQMVRCRIVNLHFCRSTENQIDSLLAALASGAVDVIGVSS
jgi:hypothetical protein